MPKPIFFLVHGANVGSFAFAPIIPLLWAKGYGTWCLELPFHSGDPNCTAGEVIAFIRKELQRLINEGREVITVCWSFGAKIAPPAFEGLFKTPLGKGKGKGGAEGEGGIVRMVFACCPLMERTGWSIKDNSARWDTEMWFEGYRPEDLFEMRDSLLIPTSGQGTPFASCMYSSLPPSLFPVPYEIFDPLLRPLSTSTQTEPLTYYPVLKRDPEDIDEPGDWAVPTAYILAEEDVVIPPGVQERMVKRWEGKWVKVYRVKCGHMIWIARPEEAVDVLADFAENVP